MSHAGSIENDPMKKVPREASHGSPPVILWEKELRKLAGRRPGKSRTRNDQSMYVLLLMVQKSHSQPPEMYETI